MQHGTALVVNVDFSFVAVGMLKRDKRDPNAWRLGSDGTVYRLGKMRYSNGDLYTGEICQGKRCGSGKMEYKCGDVYTGEFDMGKVVLCKYHFDPKGL